MYFFTSVHEGAVVGTPAEVALIRMTSDMRRPVAERRNYTNVFNALGRIYAEEGLLKMWSGCTPTVTRAVILNAAQLSVYSQAKGTCCVVVYSVN